MPPLLHSSFSASGSARLLNCPGSYKLTQDADDGKRRSTVYSAEGTLAHAISEACISTGAQPVDFVGQTRTADGFEFTVDDTFAEDVGHYVAYVRGLKAMGYAIALETRVDPSVQWDGLARPPIALFGTCDCIAYHPGTKTVAIGDLKFGRGVPVDAEGNTQLRYYGAGAAHPDVIQQICERAGVPYNGIEHVSMTIIQPRAYHPLGPVRRDTLTLDELRTWARTVLYEGVKRALADDGTTLSAGKWCRFCPVLAHCSKPRDLSFQTARAAFLNTPIHNMPAPDDPSAGLPEKHLTDDKLAELLDKIEVVEPWLKAIKELAHERLTAGHKLEGFKLVPKKARRKWADDDDAVLAHLTQAGIDPADVTSTVLKSPAQVERAVGKARYKADVAGLVVRQSSGTTIAVEGDPRKRIERRDAATAFGVKKTP